MCKKLLHLFSHWACVSVCLCNSCTFTVFSVCVIFEIHECCCCFFLLFLLLSMKTAYLQMLFASVLLFLLLLLCIFNIVAAAAAAAGDNANVVAVACFNAYWCCWYSALTTYINICWFIHTASKFSIVALKCSKFSKLLMFYFFYFCYMRQWQAKVGLVADKVVLPDDVASVYEVLT